jgi:hypothetical protein
MVKIMKSIPDGDQIENMTSRCAAVTRGGRMHGLVVHINVTPHRSARAYTIDKHDEIYREANISSRVSRRDPRRRRTVEVERRRPGAVALYEKDALSGSQIGGDFG